MATSVAEEKAKRWGEHMGYFEKGTLVVGEEYEPKLTAKGRAWWDGISLSEGSRKVGIIEASLKEMSRMERKSLMPKSQRRVAGNESEAPQKELEGIESRRKEEGTSGDGSGSKKEAIKKSTDEAAAKEDQEVGESRDLATKPTYFRLFDLPQELRDEIFDLAYPRIDSNFRLANKGRWEMVETSKSLNDPNYQPLLFKHKVDEFLVSKEFFVAASRAYMGNQIIDSDVDGALVRAYARHIKAEYRVGMVEEYHRLDVFEYVVNVVKVGAKPQHLAFNGAMDDAQITQCSLFDELRDLSGLQSLKLEADDEVTGDRSAIWIANVSRIQVLLEQLVTKPKVINHIDIAKAKRWMAQGKPLRLYEESKVMLNEAQDDAFDLPDWYAYGSLIVKAASGKVEDQKRIEVEDQQETLQSVSDVNLSENEDKPARSAAEAISDLLTVQASVSSSHAKVDTSAIPDTDKEIMDMIASNPAGMVAWIRETKAKEARRVELEAALSSVSSALGGIKLD